MSTDGEEKKPEDKPDAGPDEARHSANSSSTADSTDTSKAQAEAPLKAPKSPRRLALLSIRILGVIILIFAIGACIVIFNKESVYWCLVNSTKSLGESNKHNPLIPTLSRLAYLLGETYLPDRKYILRALSTGRDATDDPSTKESLSNEYKSWFGLSPSREFDKHYVDAVTLSKNPATLKQALKEATEASKCATDANKTTSAARAFALALCADLHRKLGRSEEPLYLDRRAVLAASNLWFDDDIDGVPVRLGVAKVYLSINHIDDALEQLSIINRAYKDAFADPIKHGSSEEELFEILQLNSEVKARAHQTAEADSYAQRAIELAEKKLKSPEMIARAYIAKAAVFLEEKKWTEAQDALKKAEKLKEDSKTWNADDVRLYLYLAFAQSQSGDKQSAEKSLANAEKYCRSKRTHARIAEYKKICLGPKT